MVRISAITAVATVAFAAKIPPGTISTLWAANQNGVFSVSADAEGTVYAVDFQHNVIKKIWANGSVTVFAGASGGNGGDGGPASSAQLSAPSAVAINPVTGA